MLNVVLIFVFLVLMGASFSSENSGKSRAVMFFLAISIFPLKIFFGNLEIKTQIAQHDNAARVESKEQLENVFSAYSNVDSESHRKIRSESIEIKESPLDILSIAATVSYKSDSLRFYEDSLKEIFYVAKWVESGYEKYDSFFRGDEFERRGIRYNKDAEDWMEGLFNKGDYYYRSDVEISFHDYDFEKGSFSVKFASAKHYDYDEGNGAWIGSGFSSEQLNKINRESLEHKYVDFDTVRVSLFNDGKDRTDGAIRTGDSISSTVFPDVDPSRVIVPEEYARDIDVDKFTAFSTAYFNADDAKIRMHTKGTVNLPCDFIDIYETEKREDIHKTIRCDEINKEVGVVLSR